MDIIDTIDMSGIKRKAKNAVREMYKKHGITCAKALLEQFRTSKHFKQYRTNETP
jgi:hypothetical protein